MLELKEMGVRARQAARTLATAGEAEKNAALEAVAAALEAHTPAILEANRQDVQAAATAGTAQAMLDRLALSDARIKGMADGVRGVMALADPVGEIVEGFRRPNGLRIQKVRVPMGVIGIIYEARPNVTSDAASLCLKSGNAVILRGGKEAIRSNCAILDVMAAAAEKAGLPKGSLQLVRDTSRESAREMMGLTGYLDVLIPRGGAGLIRAVVEGAKVPVIETGVGNCHLYIDESADETMKEANGEAIQTLASYTVSEAQIENLVTAKGYTDCVAFIGDESVSVVVSAREGGLTDADVAKITEIVTDETGMEASQVKIIEAEG